jgi:hypothetical protein
MASIYQRAKRVLIWLGQADHYTKLAYDTLKDAVLSVRYHIRKYTAEQLAVLPQKVTTNMIGSVICAGMRDPNSPFCPPDGYSADLYALSLRNLARGLNGISEPSRYGIKIKQSR